MRAWGDAAAEATRRRPTNSSVAEAAGLDPVAADLVVDDPLGRAEQPGGAGTVAAGGLERILEQVALERRNRLAQGARDHGGRGLRGLERGRQVVAVDHVAVGDEDGALDGVLQL